MVVDGSPPNLRRCDVLSRTDDLALLMGRVFVAALFLPHGFHKLMTFCTFAASLGAAKGVAIIQRDCGSGGCGRGPRTPRLDPWLMATRDRIGVGCAHPPDNLDDVPLRNVASVVPA